MKNTKTCPKCGCTEVLRIEGSVGTFGAGNNIQIGYSRYSAVEVTRYVCCQCGYSEEWIYQEDIPKLKERFG